MRKKKRLKICGRCGHHNPSGLAKCENCDWKYKPTFFQDLIRRINMRLERLGMLKVGK